MSSSRSSVPLALLLAAGTVVGGIPCAHAADPPRVIGTSPANGAEGVDPGLTEIRVRFDQDMGAGCSLVMDASALFPEVAGPQKWIDSRTLVLPVRLQAGSEYAFSVNSERHTNFQSLSGLPAIPYRVRFRTSGPAQADEKPAEPHEAAFARLQRYVAERYSHRDRLGLDWDRLFELNRAALEGSRIPREFAVSAAALLAAAQDTHIWLDVGGERIASFRPNVSPNIDLSGVRKAVPVLRQICGDAFVGSFPDGAGYLLLGSLNRRRVEIGSVLHALDGFQDAPSLIVDLRGNGGGDETLAQEIAGCFIDAPVVYARSVMRDAGAPSGFTEPFDRVLSPAGSARPRYRGRVVVLQGPGTVSSGEAFVLMMRQVAGCISVGDMTRGSSGNPQPYDLGNGVVVYLPSWKELDMLGREIEGRGIAPDVLVVAGPDAFRTGDPVIAKAREILGGDR